MFHPAAYLFVWITFAVAVQLFDWPALLAVLVLLLTQRAAYARWWSLVRRARWLLVTLWLILAYGTPGDLWLGLSWAPSVEGIDAATVHALRLVLLLGSLAALFQALPHDRFLASLWVATRPFQSLGLRADRTVARLGLVFDYLEHAPPRNSWRHFLQEPGEEGRVIETVTVELPTWQTRDWMLTIGGVALNAGLVALP